MSRSEAQASAASSGPQYGSGASQSSSSVGGTASQPAASSQPAGASQPPGSVNRAPARSNRAGAAGGGDAQLCILYLPRNHIRFDASDVSTRLRQSARAIVPGKEHDPDHRRVIQVIIENVCVRAWIYATLML